MATALASPAMALTVRGVYFDAAGTLIELREPVGETYARFAQRHGADVPASRLEEAFRRIWASAPPMVFPGVTSTLAAVRERTWWRQRVDDTFRAADGTALPREFDALFDTLWHHYAGAGAWQLRAGVPETLASLAEAGAGLGVISNFDQRLRGLLQELGIHDFFEAVVLPGDCGAAKPDARIFDVALKRLGLAPHQAAFVGDRAVEDVAAAREAGLRAIDVGDLATLAELPKALTLPAPETP